MVLSVSYEVYLTSRSPQSVWEIFKDCVACFPPGKYTPGLGIDRFYVKKQANTQNVLQCCLHPIKITDELELKVNTASAYGIKTG